MTDPEKKQRMNTFAVYVEDKPGVLNRISSLFRRRNYNIDSLNVGRTHEDGISRMTIVCRADEDQAKRIEANLYKLVNVLRVDNITEEESVERTLVLIKVAVDAEKRSEVMQICEVFRARVVDVTPESLMIEATGPVDKIRGLVGVLEPFEILELVQTGSVVMQRGSQGRGWIYASRPKSTINAA